MEKLDHKVTVKFAKSDYEFLKDLASKQKLTMAELLRQSWFQSQNTLGIFEQFDTRINQIEKAIQKQQLETQLNQHFAKNDKQQIAIYKALKEILASQTKESSHVKTSK